MDLLKPGGCGQRGTNQTTRGRQKDQTGINERKKITERRRMSRSLGVNPIRLSVFFHDSK